MTFTPWVTKEREPSWTETWFVVWRLFLILGTKPSYPSACRPGGASPPPASSTFTTSTFPDPGFCSLQVAELTFLPSLLKAIFLLMTGRASQCFLLSEASSRSSPGVSTLFCKSNAANGLFWYGSQAKNGFYTVRWLKEIKRIFCETWK